jgi:DNA-binding NtrC family response regulator
VNVRVLSATNADLKAEVDSGHFRPDLLFRLNTIEVQLPPLRERKEDVPLLAGYFLKEYAQRYRKPLKGFEPTALKNLLEYAWPGNVRELDHSVERAVLMSTGENVRPEDLSLQSRDGTRPIEEMSLEEVESLLIRKALARHGGNVSHAAETLGLSRGSLYRRIEKYGL